MANYKEIQQGVRKLLDTNIQEENKKQEQNKNNSQELF
jgi:hypothetical protein